MPLLIIERTKQATKAFLGCFNLHNLIHMRLLKSSVAFTLCFLILFNCASAQRVIEHQINWQQAIKAESEAGLRPQFKGAVIDLAVADVPRFCASIKWNNARKPVARLSGVKWESVPDNQQGVLRNLGKVTEPELQVNLGISRDQDNLLSYCFFPFRYYNGRYQKASSFSILIESQPESSLAPRSLGTQGQRASSVLATGDWYKLAVSETGMHKITPAYLADNGISSGAISINDLRIVGNGEGMLPESMTEPRPDDLRAVPLHIEDRDNDGLFNNNDFALFYARGPHQWIYDENNDRFINEINVYRTRNFYFLSINSGPGSRPSSVPSLTNGNVAVNTFDDYAFVEDEDINLVGTGRQWFGDAFEFTLSYNYDFSFPNIVTAEPVKLLVDVIARSNTAGTFMNTSYLGAPVLTSNFAPINSNADYPDFARRSRQRTTFNAQGPNITLNLTYNNTANPTAVAWLDEIEIQARRQLRMVNNELRFRDTRSVGVGNVADFSINAASNDLKVWDVTDLDQILEINGNFSAGTYQFGANAAELREYVAFRGSNHPEPAFVGAVENQNLHALSVPEMVIISHPDFLNQARELADFHNQLGDVQSAVVTTEEVYNEYSSGGQDITGIRDFVKSLYDRQPGQLKYLLLFGDASYDYKDRLAGNNNFVPVWQSEFSFNLGGAAVITDDYYAYLDPGEGVNFIGAIMDIGVGRMTCANTAQAQVCVDKVKHYVASNSTYGDWRNRVMLMTDDVDEFWEPVFVNSSERLTQRVRRASRSFNVEKIYSDAYRQETTTGSQTYPEASRDMFRKVQQGCLLVNYIGHGGEIGLSSERLLDLADVNNWTNYDALALFVTITCEFTRFDDPRRVSAGEQLFLNANGGAIGLLTTTRVVTVQGAVPLNESVFDTILARPGGQPQTLGEIIRAAKNGPGVIDNGTKSKFSLIGDPALRLAIPFQNVRTTEINNQPLSPGAPIDTLQALSKVNIQGQVEDLNGSLDADFNGTLQLSVYDKPTDRETLVNDGVGNPLPFEVQNSLIYRGKVQVENGRFAAEFRVPLDISYRFGFGKFSYYAADPETDIDAAGYMDTVIVGGFDTTAPADDRGPEIQLYLNDQSFVRGGITGPEPFLFARLSDSSGINTVGNGVGHDLKAILDDRTDQPLILNEFYEADLNSYQSGEVRFQLLDVEEGEHSLRLQAFDIYNNPSEAQTEFIVSDNEELVLRRVLNYPNPFTTFTDFQFEHNRANQPLDVQVQIFTVSGKLVKTINTSINSSGNRATGITWNGLDDYGDKIGKGVYVYRVKVRAPLDNSTADKFEKLVILR